ncbi:MAG: aldo/keto reductase [Myxococcota bacterium]
MRALPFGPTGTTLPAIGLGTWNLERDDRVAAIRALRRGVELGARHVDTAELYGNGEVERIVAEALADRRDEIVLVSKVLPHNASRTGTIAACERSLGRLRTDRLDGYLLHWEGPHPLADTIEAFEQLRRDGKIRWWGVSNFDEERIAEVVSLAGPGRCACNQVLYHLQQRQVEHRVIPACRAAGIAVVGYSPFGSGSFAGPTTPDGRALVRIADRHRTTARRVALAYLTRDDDLFAIPKASDAAHVEDNVAAGDLRLDPEDLAAIDDAFPRGPWRPGVPTL